MITIDMCNYDTTIRVADEKRGFAIDVPRSMLNETGSFGGRDIAQLVDGLARALRMLQEGQR